VQCEGCREVRSAAQFDGDWQELVKGARWSFHGL